MEKKFSEPVACKFFWQILSAIQYLHLMALSIETSNLKTFCWMTRATPN